MALFVNEPYPFLRAVPTMFFSVLLRKVRIPGTSSTSHGITYPVNYIFYLRAGVLLPLARSQRKSFISKDMFNVSEPT